MARKFEHRSSLTTSLKYVARARFDYSFEDTRPWMAAALVRAKAGVITTHTVNPEHPMGALPSRNRCVANDQFAFGPASSMDGYASLFPDFQDFVRSTLLFRFDGIGKTNEQLLAQHMHYRGVQFEEKVLTMKLHGCGGQSFKQKFPRTESGKFRMLKNFLGEDAQFLKFSDGGIESTGHRIGGAKAGGKKTGRRAHHQTRPPEDWSQVRSSEMIFNQGRTKKLDEDRR